LKKDHQAKTATYTLKTPGGIFNSSFLGELDVAFTQKIKAGYFIS